MDKTLVKHRRTLIFRDYQVLVFLLTFLLTTFGVKASNGVKFNSAVRYSQWAINSRANDFYANTAKFGLAKFDTSGKKINERINGKKTNLDYVPGLVAKAMIEAADYYNGFDWSRPWFLSVKEYGDAYFNTVKNTGGSLDDLNAVKLYFGIYNNPNSNETDKANAKTAISRAQAGLVKHNINHSIQSGTLAGANVVGGWFHKTAYNNQMWLDGAYMGSALLAQIVNFNSTNSNIFGSTTEDWNMVFKQLNIVWNMCWNSTDKLMYHAFEANAGTGTSDSHADTWAGLNGKTKPYTFHSAAYWGRANAWYLLALVDVLEAMNNANQSNTTNYKTLKQHLEDLAAGIAARQDITTGGWYQLLDKDATYTASKYNSNWSGKPNSVTNYIETSATAIIAAAYLKATRLNLLSSTTQYDYKTIAKNAFEGLVNNFTYLDKDGNLEIWGSCKSAGLGGGTGSEYAAEGSKYRDGSKEYYLLGYDVPMVKESDGITEGKVLGGFIMAATEYERAYQNQDSKQILFARDLASSYDFTTTAGTLDATAYGNGTISYQWYKDGKAIADATSATYTPTVTGKYYCVATANAKSAGGNTIRTSTTTVTKANTDNGSTDNGGSENGTTGVIFSYTIKTSEAAANTPYTAEGGTVKLGAAKKVDDNGFKSDGNLGTSKYILVSLTNQTLKEGDVIKISAYSASTGKGGLIACNDKTTGASSVSLGNMTQNDEDLVYTITANDILNGLSTFYIYRKTDEATYIKSITITRPVNKYKVSATAGTGGSVSIANGSGTTVNSGSEVEENTSLTFTATPNSGYEFVNWTDASNTEVSTKATYTTTVKAAISLTANFKATTPVTPTEDEVIYDWKTSVGTTTVGTNCTSNREVITFSSNFNAKEGKYITIKSKTGGFKAGDAITLKGYCNSPNLSGVVVYSDVNGNSIFQSNTLAKSADGGSEFTFTLTEDCDALYLGRFGGGTTCLTSLQVKRPASPSNKTRLTASFERNADVVVNTTSSVTLPSLTVKAGNSPLSADQYTVVYKSNAEDVATLSGNTITIKKLGIATITATITPTDANTYEGTTATYQLSVKAPSPLNVSAMDVTINTTDAEVEQPVIKVYGDNDKLLKLGKDYTLSYTVSGDNNVTIDETTGIFSVTKTESKWTKGTSLITVTATPTESLGSNYTVGTLQFSYSVSEGKIKPVFLNSFNGITIKLHQDSNNRTITVPLIYNGEEVSSYFKYTYTITAQANGQVQKVTKNTLDYTPSTAGKYTITVTAEPGQNGEDYYGDVYDSPDPISFYLDVKSTYQVITVTPDPASIKMYTGTTHVAPDLTVTNENTTLADTEYKTLWFSTSPGVVKVDATTGKLEAVSEGNANIRVVVTGDNLESTTALITVDVDDPAVYRVHANEEYKSQKTMWNQDKNLSVTLGGWLFPNSVKDLWPTSEPLSNTVEWNYDDSQKNYNSRKAPWKITGFDYIVKAGDKQKNARQENGSNSMPETTVISNVDYSKKDKIVDPMFNVPCSGSFLTFQPKTNGTVVAHIYQNGVFDSKKNKDNTIDYQYRPQRRVFIMDEAGNFVSSDAHIESTTGKPNGKNYDLNQYKWDMGDKQPPTVETVKKHFGLESFEMSETGFKNNVYENQLDQKIAPNEAATKYPNLKGSRGWSVLADAPVTYKFKVKAGKTYYLYNFGSKIGFYGFSFDEDATAPIVDEIRYDENSTNTVKKTETGHVAKVSINRSFKKGIWTTCVLPFSLNKQQVDAIFGTTYGVTNDGKGNSVTHSDGTQILYFDRIEGNKAYFVRHAYNTIVAGKPFLIKPTKDVESINTADVIDYPYVTIENETPADWCKSNGYVWKSSYSNDMTVEEGDCFISKSDGTFKNYRGASGTLKGFRGFLHQDKTSGAKPMMLSIATSTNIEDNSGSTTGIDLVIDADDNTISGPTTGKIYNVNGQLVSDNIKDLPSLPSGIYIINGKKYIK
ncbi:glycoside hydrolase family 88 protein [Leyella stercorea]|uniref:glycoside hydrolase family 88 protein n=1 Tax=Leyella stercorea TaxID=363265 RepID=UPI0024307238|nr:glycoside hydrolase family 88 protein [Leyella stercorea]